VSAAHIPLISDHLWRAADFPHPSGAIKRALRDLTKERTALERNEKKMNGELKKMATKGQLGACKHIAKDIVRCRNQVTKTFRMQTQLQSIQNQITSMKATHASTEGMKKMLEVMVVLNEQMELPALQQLAVDFGMENEKFNLQQELMEDVMDEAFMDDEGVDEDTEAQTVLDSVLAGMRLQAEEEFGVINGSAPAQSTGPTRIAMAADGGNPSGASGEDPEMDDLEARLAALRKQ